MKPLFPPREEQAKISLLTVHSSMLHYLYEVPVDSHALSTKPASALIEDGYPQYVTEIIHNGNTISLMPGITLITADNFFEPSNLEKNAKYLYWTFDKWFPATLKTAINKLSAEQTSTAIQVLAENPIPYDPKETLTTPFSKLAFCNRKVKSMRKHGNEYDKMFELDTLNRNAIMESLRDHQEQLALRSQPEPETLPNTFISLLKSVKGSPEATFQFMRDECFRPLVNERIKGTVRIRDIFAKIPPDGNGSNPRGVNGTIMAFLDFFDIKGWFEAGRNTHPPAYKDFLTAFLGFTGNSIGNLDTILGRREDDEYYKLVMAKLNRRAKSLQL